MTLEKITKILAEFRDFDEGSITAETSFQELGLDSLDIVDLIMKLEEEFEISIPMNENLKTIGNVVEFIDSAKSN